MIFGSKRVSRSVARNFVAALLLLLASLAANPLQAQLSRRTRRESTANRKERIARLTRETYEHRWEAAGGGGYVRERSGPYLQRNNEVAFFGSAMYSLTPKFGLLSEISGAYGNAKVGNNPYLNNYAVGGYKPQISQYTFTAGPSYRFYAKQRFAVTGFATGGLGLGKFDTGSKNFTSAELGLWQTGYNAAFTAGVDLDYNFYPNLAFRVAPKFIGTTFSNTLQANKGFNVGLVYRFGKIK